MFYKKGAQLRPKACNFFLKKTPTRVFSYEYSEIIKNILLYRLAPVAASGQ